jgi:uncharacterized membrane protein
MTLGVAVVGAVAGAGAGAGLGSHFAAATHPGWWIIAGTGVAVLVLGALTTTRWAYGTAEATAQRFNEAPLGPRYAHEAAA